MCHWLSSGNRQPCQGCFLKVSCLKRWCSELNLQFSALSGLNTRTHTHIHIHTHHTNALKVTFTTYDIPLFLFFLILFLAISTLHPVVTSDLAVKQHVGINTLRFHVQDVQKGARVVEKHARPPRSPERSAAQWEAVASRSCRERRGDWTLDEPVRRPSSCDRAAEYKQEWPFLSAWQGEQLSPVLKS